jgi:hypothetical protein
VDLEGGNSRRNHPFGRWANLLVLAGTSLSIIQSVVVALGAVSAPLNEGVELTGLPLGAWLLAGVGLPGLVGWTALRALRAWWRRSVTVLSPLLLASVLAAPSTWLLSIPLGEELLTPIGYLPASLFMLAAAVMARPRIAQAQREGRGGLGT